MKAALSQHIAEFQPDVMHCHNLFPELPWLLMVLYARLACRQFKACMAFARFAVPVHFFIVKNSTANFA